VSNLKPFSEYSVGVNDTHWLIEDMLVSGGTSILAGDPKTGKSQLVRHLIKAVLTTEDFLGKPVRESGKVMYLALEENPYELKSQILGLGIPENAANLLIGDRLWTNADTMITLEEDLNLYKPMLCVIDTFGSFTSLDDINDYQNVYKFLRTICKSARENDCHVMFVHHKNKNSNEGSNNTKSIMGSTAFYGAMDTALLLSGESEKKVLEVNPRYAAKQRIDFNMTRSEISELNFALSSQTARETIFSRIQRNPDGIEKRLLEKGHGKTQFQAALSALLEEGLIQMKGGTKGNPAMLYPITKD